MNPLRKLVPLVVLLALAACGDEPAGSRPQETNSDGTKPATDTDRDPTPETGTGGPSQSIKNGQTGN